jgi:hypothetical protein
MAESKTRPRLATFISLLVGAALGGAICSGELALFAWLSGVSTLNGITQAISIVAPSILAFALVAAWLIEANGFSKAEEKELKAEDDILLQGTAFSQAALWIYLNIVPDSAVTAAMKVLVPSGALLFYSMRAYAKLKDSSLWRYRSLYVLSFVVVLSIVAVVGIFGGPELVIEGKNLQWMLALPLVNSVLVLALFRSKLKSRYDLLDKKGQESF